MKTLSISILILSLLFSGFDAHTTGKGDYSPIRNYYFLSPDGNDEAAGNHENPWQSIKKANESLQPGDVAIFLPGEYRGTISPVYSGTAYAPITYRSFEPRKAYLLPEEEREIIRLDGHEHIIISDFYVDGENRANWGTVRDSRHITIRGCTMRRNPRIMQVSGSSQVQLLDNLFSADRMTGDMLHLVNSNELLFEGNSTTRVGHCPLRILNCFNVAVRGNVFRAEWGRNYEVWNSARLLMEGNIITRARDSRGSGGTPSKNTYDHSIYRHNLVFDNLHTPLRSSSYIWRGIKPASPEWRGPFVAVNSRIYHNTITDNLGLGWELNGINVSSNIFQNNIFYRNDHTGGGTQVMYGNTISGDNRFITNILRASEPDRPTVNYRGDFLTTAEANQNTPTVGGFWSVFHENIDAAPSFLDSGNRDYRLTSGSAAIDTGTPLALAMGNGTGNKLPVNDGYWFYDGFGIEGEEGDWIAVGEGDNIAQILRVELRYYQPAILHLDRDVTWTDGMPVSLPWTGKAPDLGAIPYMTHHPTYFIALASPAAVEPGQKINFSLETFGKEVESVKWDFEDGTFSNEKEPIHTYAETGHYGVTARVTFTGGRRGVAAFFVNVPERIVPVLPLVDIDFEDETLGIKWGMYMKFYRPHQTGQRRVERPDGKGKCMHLFYNSNNANTTTAQIAPGAWDIDDYPLVCFSYRIPEGIPVSIELTTFGGPDQPDGFTLGGSSNGTIRYVDLNKYTLIDDGKWHDITLDVRAIRKLHPELKHLRQFMLYTNWREDEGQEFWFDNFAILPDN